MISLAPNTNNDRRDNPIRGLGVSGLLLAWAGVTLFAVGYGKEIGSASPGTDHNSSPATAQDFANVSFSWDPVDTLATVLVSGTTESIQNVEPNYLCWEVLRAKTALDDGQELPDNFSNGVKALAQKFGVENNWPAVLAYAQSNASPQGMIEP